MEPAVACEQPSEEQAPAEPEVLDLTPEMEAEKLAQAKAHVKAKEFDAGIDMYAQVLRFRVTKLGELAPETAPLYYDYGDALLRKAESCMDCLLYTSPSPRDRTRSRMPSSA
eukprot:TRINITY_DN27222_c0_g1_i2.p1 TRINITY_DN27222_c0_g1~~TRINITY_DN27222_c0_g1_i2.p1  ORF type:complete len:112 (-),score=36.18 TRINITY_DN27222_c0_g1_i2:15-350(-)